MTSEKKIDVGDVVQLKEGGPWMTVDRIDAEHAVCLWQEGELLRREIFRLAELVYPEFKADEDLSV